MVKSIYKTMAVVLATVAVAAPVWAGNQDRSGQAGAPELLINPWARCSGWGNANTAGIKGYEAAFLNIAGTAHTKKTEIILTHTNWLVGTGINVNALGFTQRVGESGVMGIGLMTMDFGKLNVTTSESPEGGMGTFTPQFVNMGVSYAKEFSNSIFGGVNVKVISESISNVKAQGVAFDAGIQYVTGKRQQMKLGIALRNVGAPLTYRGDGLASRAVIPLTGVSLTVEQRTAKFDLPSQVNIGIAYDHYFAPDNTDHRLTGALNFTSNSFSPDQFCAGVEYAFKSKFMFRGGYVYQKGLFDADKLTALTGPTAGMSVEYPLSENGTTIALDYSYRASNPFGGVHSIGARINL